MDYRERQETVTRLWHNTESRWELVKETRSQVKHVEIETANFQGLVQNCCFTRGHRGHRGLGVAALS
jgi:hypothetical protein